MGDADAVPEGDTPACVATEAPHDSPRGCVAADAPEDSPRSKRRRLHDAPAAAEDGDGVAGGTLMVRNLPCGWDAAAVRKLLDDAGVRCASVRKSKGRAFAFVTFGFLSDRLRAETELPKQAPGGRALNTAAATTRTAGDAGRDAPDAAAAAASRAARDVRDAVCPLWATPYAEQLMRKQATVAAALQQLTRATRKLSHGPPPQWVRGGGAACPLAGIVGSPVRDGYRNRTDFTIGVGGAAEGGAATVGFNVGLFSEGFAAVASAAACPHVSPAARALAAWTQAHLRSASTVPPWDKRAGAGFWRLLLVREGGMAQRSGAGWRTFLVDAAGAAAPAAAAAAAEAPEPPAPWEGQAPPRDGAVVLVLVQINPTGHDAAVVRSECAALATALRAVAAAAHPPLPLGALLVQVHTGCSNAAPEDAPVMLMDAYGDDTAAAAEAGVLHERLFSLRFRISPQAFFQVNTAAAEALYDLAGEWAARGAPPEKPQGDDDAASRISVLYDTCCGTGTIGLTLAHRFARVEGVDICEPAVRDAVANAEANGVTTARFHAGRAEEVLQRLLSAAPSERAVAIVDPPRAGLHRAVLGALRAAAGISRLVYVSCNVDTMANDAAALCASGGGSRPFKPVRCCAVDLFPHTKHVEAVLLLERDAA